MGHAVIPGELPIATFTAVHLTRLKFTEAGPLHAFFT